MAELPIPAGKGVPLVDMVTKRLPEAVVEAHRADFGSDSTVVVVTGIEARPDAPVVFWVDQRSPVYESQRPLLMANVDLWFHEPFTIGTPPAVTAPVIQTTTLGTLTQGQQVSVQLAHTGSPAVYSTVAGQLPNGLSLSAAGLVSGSPTAPGVWAAIVQAANSAGADTQELSGTVAAAVPGGTAPVITTTTLNAMQVGVPYSQIINYTGDTATAVSLAGGSLPTGLAFTLTAGVVKLEGTPTVATGFTSLLQVANATGSDTQSLAGTVDPADAGSGWTQPTLPGGVATVFGANPPVGVVAAPYSDAPAGMRAGNRFYTSRVGGYEILGARLWNPIGASTAFLETPVTAYAYVNTWNGSTIKGVPTFANAPLRTKTGSGLRQAGTWSNLLFDTPLHLPKIASGEPGALLTIALNIGAYYVMSASGLAGDASFPGPSGDLYLPENMGIIRSVHSLSVNDGEVYPDGPIYGVDVIAVVS